MVHRRYRGAPRHGDRGGDRASKVVVALVAFGVAMTPGIAEANSFDGLGALLLAMFVGLPLAAILLLLGVVAAIFLIRRVSAPRFGLTTMIAAVVQAVLMPLLISAAAPNAHRGELALWFGGPFVLLALPIYLVGAALRRRARTARGEAPSSRPT